MSLLLLLVLLLLLLLLLYYYYYYYFTTGTTSIIIFNFTGHNLTVLKIVFRIIKWPYFCSDIILIKKEIIII